MEGGSSRSVSDGEFGNRHGVRIISTFLLIVFAFSTCFANFLDILLINNIVCIHNIDNLLKPWTNDNNCMDNLTILF